MKKFIGNAPSSYLLIWRNAQTQRLKIGMLGDFIFPEGWYVYAGSAQGSGGVRGRVAHHLRIAKNPRWHFDWLRPALEPHYGLVIYGLEQWECRWAQFLSSMTGSRVIAPGFGASDCRNGCSSHLIYFSEDIAAGFIYQSIFLHADFFEWMLVGNEWQAVPGSFE